MIHGHDCDCPIDTADRYVTRFGIGLAIFTVAYFVWHLWAVG